MKTTPKTLLKAAGSVYAAIAMVLLINQRLGALSLLIDDLQQR